MSFSAYMQVLYILCYRMPGSQLKGTYLPKPENTPAEGETFMDTILQQIYDAFTIFETDFKGLDKNRDNLVEYTDLSEAYYGMGKADRFVSLSRLQRAFAMVDLNDSKNLDFYEYMLFSFVLVQEGSYNEVVPQTADAAKIKRFLMDIYMHYGYV
jgi:hypothetical protein